MVNYGGYYSDFEKSFRSSFATTKKDLNLLSKEVQNIMFGAKLSTSSTYWNGIRKELDSLYKEMSILFEKWSTLNVPLSYKNDLIDINKRILAMRNVTERGQLTVEKLLKTTATKNITSSLVEDAITSFNTALFSGKSSLFKLTRLTQQYVINEGVFETETLKSITEYGNLKIASRNIKATLYNKLFEQMSNEQIVVAGSKTFSPGYYAEMVARVKFHEGQAYAAIAQCRNYETNLVIISNHNTATPICVPYEGRIFSIDGKGPFPRLDTTPPFHPNCLHLLFPQFESALKASKQYDAYISFSNGKTDKLVLGGVA